MKLLEAVQQAQHSLLFAPREPSVHQTLCRLLPQSGSPEAARPHAVWLMAHGRTVDQLREAALVFQRLKQWQMLASTVSRIFELSPQNRQAEALAIEAAQHGCNWPALGEATEQAASRYRSGDFTNCQEAPFSHLAWCDESVWNLEVARQASRRMMPHRVEPLARIDKARTGPLRVGYVSSDFNDHATLHLLAGVLESHDPRRVTIFAYCHSMEDGTWYRERFKRAVPGWCSLQGLTDEQAAGRIAADELDLLVDLKGYTWGCRPGIFLYRPAPIQISWLGYPGTMGAECFDYLIGDPVATPAEHQPFFTEALCRLPETYFPTDNWRPLSAVGLSRRDCQLPEQALVFACFNQPFKLEPVRFDSFMRILEALPDSVLWLLDPGEPGRSHLRNKTIQRGIGPDRLVFAAKVPAPLHLERLALADLALDTRLYNGHTTTVDCLWAGIPVLTVPGRHMASRAASGLLRAIGLDELIAIDELALVEKAVRLGQSSFARQVLKRHLADQRLFWPLFDTARFTRHLEDAFHLMARRGAEGLSPAPIDVPARPWSVRPFADRRFFLRQLPRDLASPGPPPPKEGHFRLIACPACQQPLMASGSGASQLEDCTTCGHAFTRDMPFPMMSRKPAYVGQAARKEAGQWQPLLSQVAILGSSGKFKRQLWCEAGHAAATRHAAALKAGYAVSQLAFSGTQEQSSITRGVQYIPHELLQLSSHQRVDVLVMDGVMDSAAFPLLYLDAATRLVAENGLLVLNVIDARGKSPKYHQWGTTMLHSLSASYGWRPVGKMLPLLGANWHCFSIGVPGATYGG